MKSIFTTPKVLIPEDPKKDWLVWFRYDGKLYRYKKGINYYKDLKERAKEADALAEALHLRLKQKWNPNIPEADFEPGYELNILQAIDFAIEKKKPNLARKSYLDYSGTVRYIATAIEALKFNKIPIQEIKRQHIKLILEKAQTQRTWSNKSYNKHLGQLKAILSELIEWSVIEDNPAHKIKSLPVSETSSANTPATILEQKEIKYFLEKKHPEFYVFIISIFHTGIRPEELLQIKNYMINLRKSEINLPPEITKTNKERAVPINQHLMKHLIKMNLHKFPKSFYVFGSNRLPGQGNRTNEKDFVPGPTKIKRDTATRRWNKLIKSPTGLNINVNMYSNKHAGANAKLLAGMDLDALRELYGHKSKFMTKKYATVISEIYKKQILEISPDF